MVLVQTLVLLCFIVKCDGQIGISEVIPRALMHQETGDNPQHLIEAKSTAEDAMRLLVRQVLIDPSVSPSIFSLDHRTNLTDLNVKDIRISTECWKSISLYASDIRNAKTWAITMLDAAGKIPSGVFEAAFVWPGTYNQCLKVVKSGGSPAYGGRYCSASVSLSSVYLGKTVLPLSIGLCIPDACNATDLHGLIKAGIYYIPKSVPLKANVTQTSCQIKDETLNPAAIGVIVLLSTLGAFLVIATLYDIWWFQPKLRRALSVPEDTSVNDAIAGPDVTVTANEYTSLLDKQESVKVVTANIEKELVEDSCKFLLAISIYSNGHKLLKISSARNDLRSIHGIRFISMSWVILGHTFFFGNPFLKNKVIAVDIIQRFTFQTVLNATVSVDTFFLISGLLSSYLVLKEMKRNNGSINWPLFYFHRFWRLTPPYMILLGAYETLFIYMGDGPFWPNQALEPMCASHWYYNFFYINNLIEPMKSCMAWTWYLANDMQFFIISPLILYPLYRSPIVGMIISGLIMLGSFIAAGVISSTNHLGPSGFGGQSGIYFNEYYVVPWCRIGPYLIGILFGYALYKTDCKIKIHKVLVILCWVVAAVCCSAVLYGLNDVVKGHPLSNDLSAFYNAVARSVWGLGVGWVIFACCTGYGGFVNSLLSWEPLIPLSRLTYMAYLVHPMVMLYAYLSRHSLIYYTDVNMIYFFLGHLVLSYMMAFILSVTLESPMLGLERLILGRFRK